MTHEHRALGSAHHQAVGQTRGIGHPLPEGFTVKGGESEAGAVCVPGESEAHRPMAEPARAVVENEGMARARPGTRAVDRAHPRRTRSLRARRARRASRTMVSTTSAAPGRSWMSPTLWPDHIGTYSGFCCLVEAAKMSWAAPD